MIPNPYHEADHFYQILVAQRHPLAEVFKQASLEMIARRLARPARKRNYRRRLKVA